MDFIPGFAPGIVTHHDPEGTGRIKVCIPGLIEPNTPYWVMPGGWPGAGGLSKGSQYPPPAIGGQVAVVFLYGQYREPDSQAIYLTGYYGLKPDGAQAGPPVVSSAASADDAHKFTVFWESDALLAYAVETDTDKKLVLQAKATGSKIEVNAADGTSGKSESIYIEARTLLSLYSKGLLDIKADGSVQIQGRRVDDISTRGI